MASVEKRKDGCKVTYRIRLSEGEHPDRPRIGLGAVTKKEALSVRGFIENLVSYCNTGKELKPATQDWLNRIRPSVRKRLESLGLVEPTADGTEPFTVDTWCKHYIAMRENDGQTKADTVRKLENVGRRLSLFFKGIPLESVTKLDAKNFRASLSSKYELSEATVRKHIAISRQFFNAAIEARLIDENPFRGQPVTVQANKSRFYFITPEEAQSVLEACPDSQWRLIFGLSRFGGLRCPSEVLRLKWEDVDFVNNQFTVHASKTEHHTDGGIRVVPMFPELKPLFQEVFDQAETGDIYCITQYRMKNVNLRTRLKRIIKNAGLKPWPKLFQNLRSSRETELFKLTGGNIKAVCEWIGNSPEVAMQHYAQVTEADRKQAAELAVLNSAEKVLKNGGTRGGQPMTETPEIGSKESQEEKRRLIQKCLKDMNLDTISKTYDFLQALINKGLMGDEGFEPATR